MSGKLFNIETDFALSQFDLNSFLAEEELRGNLPHNTSTDLDDSEHFNLTRDLSVHQQMKK